MRLCGSLVLLLAVLAPAPPAKPALFRVGMDTRTPPWSFVPGLDFSKEDQTKTPAITPEQLNGLTGLDVDVMNALARRLGVTPKVVPTAWPNLEAGLVAKRYDVILCAWTPSPKTPNSIVATAPYYEWGLVITVRSDNKAIHGYKDLDGARVGYYRDPAVERSLAALAQGGHMELVADDPSSLFEKLRSGVLDAVLFDSVYARWRAGRDPTFRVVGQPLNRLGYHIGVRSWDTVLIEQLRGTLRDLTASSEMVEIRRKWEKAP